MAARLDDVIRGSLVYSKGESENITTINTCANVFDIFLYFTVLLDFESYSF